LLRSGLVGAVGGGTLGELKVLESIPSSLDHEHSALGGRGTPLGILGVSVALVLLSRRRSRRRGRWSHLKLEELVGASTEGKAVEVASGASGPLLSALLGFAGPHPGGVVAGQTSVRIDPEEAIRRDFLVYKSVLV
jgi:hypothetical protein